MNIKVRFNKILLPAIAGFLISSIYFIFIFFLTSYLAQSYGAAFIGAKWFPVSNILGIIVYLFIGIVTYFICFKKKGTVIERFVSGIFFPFILGIFSTIAIVLFPSSLLGIEFAQNPELLSVLILKLITNWIIIMLEILCGSVLMHLIITRKYKNMFNIDAEDYL